MDAAHARQDSLTKPPGSLGRLESLSVQVAGITGRERPRVEDKVIITCAGDHGNGLMIFPASRIGLAVAFLLFGIDRTLRT